MKREEVVKISCKECVVKPDLGWLETGCTGAGGSIH